jgi:predicted dehydrogenase
MNNKLMKANSTLSRRQFLNRGAAAALAGAVVPSFIPSGILAAPGKPGANDRIGVGVIGMGRRAGELLGDKAGFSQAQLVGFADVNINRAKENAAKYGNGFACQDYRKLLERKEVDAIITATPEHWRALTCIHACQAGKDVYAEKPMTLTILEGRRIAEAVKKYKRVFQVGSQQRTDWTDIEACKFVREGGIGKVKKVYSWNFPSPWECALPEQPLPEGLDWDLWCGPVEKVPYNKDLYLPRANPGWLSFRRYSGGEMTGWGAHGFDMVQSALGTDAGGPIEVWTEGPKFTPVTYTQVESKKRGDQTTNAPKVFFRYANDIIMEMVDKTPDGVKPPPFGGIFVGDKGTFTIDRGRISSDPEEVAIEIMKKRPKGYNSSHIANWLNCIKSRKSPNAGVEIGHRSATVCHLGNIARWTGRNLKWDSVKEEFVGDAEANQYLDRERCKGYELPAKV